MKTKAKVAPKPFPYGKIRNVGDIGVIKEIRPEKLVLHRAQNSGKMTVTATLHNGGTAVTQAITMVVREPQRDAWITRMPTPDEQPEDQQFYARDDRNEGTLSSDSEPSTPPPA